MAGYCTHCGGTGFRRPSLESALAKRSPYVQAVIRRGQEAIADELERLQAVIAAERRLRDATTEALARRSK